LSQNKDSKSVEVPKIESRFKALTTLTKALSSSTEEKDVIATVSRHTPNVLGIKRVSIAIPSEDNLTFEVFSLEGMGGLLSVGSKMFLFGAAVGAAMEQRKVISTVYEPVDNYGDWVHLKGVGLRNFIVVPLEIFGKVFGTLNVGTGDAKPFDELDVLFAQQVGTLLATFLHVHGSKIIPDS